MTVLRKSQPTHTRKWEEETRESHSMQSTNDTIIQKDKNLVDFSFVSSASKDVIKIFSFFRRKQEKFAATRDDPSDTKK